jgi:beta-glucosidase
VRQDVGSVETPDRSLEGFSRVHLRPEERKTLTFHLKQDQLAVWNAEQRWVVEPGNYTVWVGGSSQASMTANFLLNR